MATWHWLCADGEYRQHVEARTQADPTLKEFDFDNNRYGKSLRMRSASLSLWEAIGKEPLRKVDLRDTVEDLCAHLRATRAAVSTRVYLLEGLSADHISVLGKHFEIDPAFFVAHERVTLWPGGVVGGKNKTRLQKPLPSVQASSKSFCWSYCELRDFDDPLEDWGLRCTSTARHIGATRWANAFSLTGIVRRKCSYWLHEAKDGSKDVILLCDPKVTSALYERDRVPKHYENSPFQGGYVDFGNNWLISDTTSRGPSRESLRADLEYYFQQPALYEAVSVPERVVAIASNIMASHYQQYLEFILAGVQHTEWKLAVDIHKSMFNATWVRKQWTNVQSTCRRCNQFQEDIRAILFELENKKSYPPDALVNYRHIAKELEVLSRRAERLLSSMTGLAGIVDAMRSSREANDMRTLTGLGVVFLPLAYVSSIMSMADEYLPRGGSFWIYWASSLVLLSFVCLTVLILRLGYDTNGGWSLERIVARTKKGFQRRQLGSRKSSPESEAMLC